ncbi:MAG: 4Fe-4S binding protein [Promethearchaeota archaeon]
MNAASPGLTKKIEELRRISYRAITDLSRCKSCGTCVRYCPLKIRAFNAEGKAVTLITEFSCGGCSVCYKRCRNKAIKLIVIEKK